MLQVVTMKDAGRTGLCKGPQTILERDLEHLSQKGDDAEASQVMRIVAKYGDFDALVSIFQLMIDNRMLKMRCNLNSGIAANVTKIKVVSELVVR